MLITPSFSLFFFNVLQTQSKYSPRHTPSQQPQTPPTTSKKCHTQPCSKCPELPPERPIKTRFYALNQGTKKLLTSLLITLPPAALKSIRKPDFDTSNVIITPQPGNTLHACDPHALSLKSILSPSEMTVKRKSYILLFFFAQTTLHTIYSTACR
jgi:hypothetical protein